VKMSWMWDSAVRLDRERDAAAQGRKALGSSVGNSRWNAERREATMGQ